MYKRKAEITFDVVEMRVDFIFENVEVRKLKQLRWFPLPSKPAIFPLIPTYPGSCIKLIHYKEGQCTLGLNKIKVVAVSACWPVCGTHDLFSTPD